MSGPTFTSSQLDQAAEDLDSFSTDLESYETDIQNIVASTRRNVDDVFMYWHGPRADDELARAETFLDEIAGAPRAIRAQIDIVSNLATVARGYADDLRAAENRVASANTVLNSTAGSSPTAVDHAVMQRSSAQARIEEISGQWRRAASNAVGRPFDKGLSKLDSSHDAATTTLPGRSIPTGESYQTMLVIVAATQGIDLNVLDPSGRTWTWSRVAVSDVLNSPAGPIILLALETANQGNVDDADGHLSGDDLMAAISASDSDFRIHVRNALIETGLYPAHVSKSEVDTLTSLATSVAWMWQASWDDDLSGDAERRLDEWFPNGGTELSPPGTIPANLPFDLDPDQTETVLDDLPENEDGESFPVGSVLQDGVPAVTEAVAPGVYSKAIGGAATVLGVGQLIATCGGDGDCGAAAGMLAVDTIGSAAFPIGYPTAKFLFFTLGRAYGGLQEEVGNYEPSWPGYNNRGGVLPYEAEREGYEPPEQIYRDGVSPLP